MTFFIGLIIGIIFGVPAGAIGVMAIKRTLKSGFACGIATGMGSSAADVLYAVVGLFGISVMSEFIKSNGQIISFAGGLLIALIGIIGFIKKKNVDAQEKNDSENRVICFISSFMVAILNPAAIATFVMAFALFHLENLQFIWEKFLLIMGIFTGTGIWWLTVCAIAAKMRNRITDNIYRILNYILNTLLIILGAIMAARVFWR